VICVFTKHYVQINEDEIGWVCSTDCDQEVYTNVYSENVTGRDNTCNEKKNNTEMYVKKNACEEVDWIYLAEDNNRRRDAVNMIIDP
jgi:hypothetical protein